MKIYTRTGDAGHTGLYGGDRVAKTSRRVEAYGTVDEANSAIGLARAELSAEAGLDATLAGLQDGLFDVGADLATPNDAPQSSRLSRIDAQDVERLEGLIDLYEAENSPLQHFIHPGGTRGAAALHVARAISRRAEREVLRLEAEEPTNHEVVRYLNRLSDLLFVLARVANARAGVHEEAWQVRGRERQ
jgi:cob(I)alamin adenosyltransferase